MVNGKRTISFPAVGYIYKLHVPKPETWLVKHFWFNLCSGSNLQNTKYIRASITHNMTQLSSFPT